MAVVNELVSRFSFVGDLSPQRDFNKGLAQSITLLGGFATAMIASAGGLFAFVAAGTEAADKLTDLSAETGVAVEALQELGFAAELSGSSAEQMQSSLAGLSKVAGDAARDLGRGKKAFDDLKISVKDSNGTVKTADVLFGELGAKFRQLGTDTATQKSIIASLGLDPSTLQLLNSTSEEVAALVEQSRALGIVTTEQAEAAAKLQDSLAIAKFGVSALRQQVAIGLAPAMTDITNRFVGFLEVNHELIEGGLKYLGEIIISVIGFIERMAPVVLIAAAAFGIATLATGGFATVMGIVLSPVVLITAAIVALLLIVDDLITAFQGGQSVIADFFMEFLGIDIVPIMHGVYDAFMGMVDGVISLIGKLWDFWKEFTKAVVRLFTGDWEGALATLLGAFNVLGGAIKDIFAGAFTFLGTALSQIIQMFIGDWQGALSGLMDAFNDLGGTIKNIFTGVFSFLGSSLSQIFSALKNAAMAVLPDWALKLIGEGGSPGETTNGALLPSGSGQSSEDVPVVPGLFSGSGQSSTDVPMITPNDAMALGSTNNNVSNTSIDQNVEIKITAPDAQSAGAAVSDSLQDQLKTAKTQANRGGR